MPAPTPEDLERRRERLEILEAITAAARQGSQLMVLAEKSETVDDFRAAIESWLGCSPVSARAVMELQMRRMPRAERQKITDELNLLRAELDGHGPT